MLKTLSLNDQAQSSHRHTVSSGLPTFSGAGGPYGTQHTVHTRMQYTYIINKRRSGIASNRDDRDYSRTRGGSIVS